MMENTIYDGARSVAKFTYSAKKALGHGRTTAAMYCARKLAWPIGKRPPGTLHSRGSLAKI